VDRIPGMPSEARLEGRAVACIECRQEIPCNPCESACPHGAITVGTPITNLPVLDEDKCIGCGLCIARCPGLAIFCLHKHFSETASLVSFPYEYLPLPEKGQIVRCVSRSGAYVTDGVVHSVKTAAAFDHTAIVTVEIPKQHLMDVRSMERGGICR